MERADTEPMATGDGPAPLAAEIAGQDPEAATVVVDAAPAEQATATPTSPTETKPARRLVLASIAGNLFAVTGWAVSLGLILALGWVAIQHRTGIMHAWPPSQRLFNWLGLA